MRIGLVALALAMCLVGLRAQEPAEPEAGPAFELVSIRESTERSDLRFGWTPGRYVSTRTTVVGLVNNAYGNGAPVRLEGDDPVLRMWWSIEATFDPALDPTPEQRAAMLRTMLEDRFRLVLRRETRETEVYALMLARDDGQLGTGLQPSVPCDSPVRAFRGSGNLPPDGRRPGCAPPTVSAGPIGSIAGGDIVLEGLTRALSSLLERPVVDRTGLDGRFDLVLQFAWDSAIRQLPVQVERPSDPVGVPNIFTALREQLGLELESTRAPLDYHVVERIEIPTPN